MLRSTAIFVVLLAILAGTTVQVQAGLIVDALGAAGPGLGRVRVSIFGGSFHVPGNENNDNSEESPNFFILRKRFDRTAPIDMFFLVQNSQGTTEYSIADSVTNRTNDTWRDYHFILGFGSGNDFERSNDFDFLDFDFPDKHPPPASNRFNKRNHQNNAIHWSNGTIPPNRFGVFLFSVDVPDFAPGEMPSDIRHVFPDGSIGYVFTLRQRPTTVSEPSTLALFGIGALVMLGYGWRSRRLAKTRSAKPYALLLSLLRGQLPISPTIGE